MPTETQEKKMDTTISHTPTPWAIATATEDGKPVLHVCGPSMSAEAVTSVYNYDTERSQAEHAANAAHIVRCVNAHDELVWALEAAVVSLLEYERRMDLTPRQHLAVFNRIEKARAALRLAHAESASEEDMSAEGFWRDQAADNRAIEDAESANATRGLF